MTSYNHNGSNDTEDYEKYLTKVMLGGLFALGVCILGIGKCTYHTSFEEKQTTFTINKMEVKRSGEADRYLIFTDKGVFENTDALFKLKFNSSDLHNELQPGQTYEATTVGPRIQFLSMYPNVIKARLKEKE